VENGTAEVSLWFSDQELVAWDRALDPWIFE
jgi:hypothetical protein